ncbi:MAG TPA: HAMP domain-containing sensor histidine kinase [Thermoanaerobaculia bacterium]|nr:HAMP domain-containing sensor histidine kinase [Thermoanaerobaculia bacterium]
MAVDETGTIRQVSARAAAMFGSAEKLRRRWKGLREVLEAAAPERGAVWSSGDAEVSAEVDLGRDGRVHAEILPAVESGRGRLVLLRIADDAAAEDRDLRLASHGHSVTPVYRAMAHDLRGPLNAMVVNLELLSDAVAPGATGANLEERRRRYTRVIKEETERLTRHLNAFLSQVAPPVDGRRRFDLGRQVQEVAEFISPQAKKQHVEVELDLPRGEMLVEGEPDQVRQAVLALVVNALEAQPEEGWVALSLERNGATVLLTVEDGGQGVDQGLRRVLFEPRTTTKPQRSGLGLTVARSIAARHGGSLRFAGDQDGTRFELELPAAPDQES